MFIVDAHQDIAYNHFEHGRDFLRSAHETRHREAQQATTPDYRGTAMLGFEDALRGRVGVIFGTLYVDPAWSPFAGTITYETPEEAYNHAMNQLGYYEKLNQRESRIRMLYAQPDLEHIVSAYGHDEEDKRELGILIAMEGADPIVEPEQVYAWHERGLRSVGLAWSQTRYSGGTGRPGPLTDPGVALLEHMQTLNMILDLSHMADEACFQALETYEGPVIASHSNPRHFRDSQRLIPDDIIRLIAERDGVVGLVPFNLFMRPDWSRGDKKAACTIDDYVNMIEYVCEVVGSTNHVGFGTDWDGGFGAEAVPEPFDTIADLQLVTEHLRARGFSTQDIDAITHQNFLRIVRKALPA
jgi:membrane dipeptidase